MIALIFVRILAELLCMVALFAGGLILAGMGRKDDAITWCVCLAIVAWFVRPNNEDRALFEEYQKQHAPPR